MPSSRINHIPTILSILRQLQPKSILDVGVGFGKWGLLFREYTDIVMSEKDPPRYQRDHWLIKIDGIEGFEPYITPVHRYVYDSLFIGDMVEKIKEVNQYDVVFLGDVIEHLEKGEGRIFLRDCLGHAKKAVIISTPATETEQYAVCGNELEIHRSLWTASDFNAVGRCKTKLVENDILIAVMLCNETEPPVLESVVRSDSFRSKKRRLWQRIKSYLRLSKSQ